MTRDLNIPFMKKKSGYSKLKHTTTKLLANKSLILNRNCEMEPRHNGKTSLKSRIEVMKSSLWNKCINFGLNIFSFQKPLPREKKRICNIWTFELDLHQSSWFTFTLLQTCDSSIRIYYSFVKACFIIWIRTLKPWELMGYNCKNINKLEIPM